jgi:molybdenum cofactor guanylyltransferase
VRSGSGSPPELYDAVVLAGGASRRMGQDKPSLYVGELTLLDRVLSSVPTAQRVVVVGPERPVTRDVAWTQEDPPGAGPVAALAAGLALVEAPRTVLLAADLPFVAPATVGALLAALGPELDGAVLVDDGGRDQYLCSAWRTDALRSVDLTVDRMGLLVGQLSYAQVRLPVAPGEMPPWTDCDTPEDLHAARGSR